jgi:APA family basic amino acid/polyamine antiporter
MDIALPLIPATNADGESGMHGFEGHRSQRSAPFAGATPYAAAQDGLFPAAFARRRRGVPTVGVGVTVVLASLLTVYNYTSGSGKVFEVLVLVTTFTATVPYLLATAAQIFHLVAGRRERVDRARLVRDAVVAAVAAAFSMWLVAGAGYAAVYQGVLFLFAGVIVYAVLAARRRATA